MTTSEPGGISNLGPRCLSIFRACDTVNVDCCPMAVKVIIPDAQMGIICIMRFTSSTCWIVQSLHLFEGQPLPSLSPSSIRAPLFRHLS